MAARVERPTVGIDTGPRRRFASLPDTTPARWENFLLKDAPGASEYRDDMTSSEYYSYINGLIQREIMSDDYHDPKTGYIADTAWKRLVDGGILAASFGDRGQATRQEEIMTVARILSYYDLSLGLSFGITTALAIMPLQRFGSEAQQKKYLDMIRDGKRIGLAITEKSRSGSSTFDMDSNYVVNNDGTVTLTVDKHLQGFSGKTALLVAAERAHAKKKTIGIFIVDQEDMHTQLTKMQGLFGIPYGINTGNITLSSKDHFMVEIPREELPTTFQDIFTKSRILFIGMTLGHQERMEEEAQNYAIKRIMGGRRVGKKIEGGAYQADMPNPRYRLNKIRTRGIILDAIARRVAEYTTSDGQSLLNGDTTGLATEASIVKALSAEYAYASAEDRAILRGGDAFFEDKALQDLIDVWAFQIFEGTKDMLNAQIGRDILRSVGSPGIWGTIENLDRRFYGILKKIASLKKLTPVHERIFGQISARIFALGCIDKENLDLTDFKRAKKLLNLEIQQLELEFFSIDEDD